MKAKYLKPLHKVIKDMEWDARFKAFVKNIGSSELYITVDEFDDFGKEIPEDKIWLYPKSWIEERKGVK